VVSSVIGAVLDEAVKRIAKKVAEGKRLSDSEVMILILEQINRRIEVGFNNVDKRFEDLKEYVDRRFDDINRRFEDINKRFDDVNKRIDDLNTTVRVLVKEVSSIKSDVIVLLKERLEKRTKNN